MNDCNYNFYMEKNNSYKKMPMYRFSHRAIVLITTVCKFLVSVLLLFQYFYCFSTFITSVKQKGSLIVTDKFMANFIKHM